MGSPEHLKIDVLLLLFERPNGIALSDLAEDFCHFHGHRLDLPGHGYPSLYDLIQDMFGMVTLWDDGLSPRLLARVPGSPGPSCQPQDSLGPSSPPRPLLSRPPPASCPGLLPPPFWSVPRVFTALRVPFPVWRPIRPAPRPQPAAYPGARPPPAPCIAAGDQRGGKEAPTTMSPPRQSSPVSSEGSEASRGLRTQAGSQACRQGPGERPMTYSQALQSRSDQGPRLEGRGRDQEAERTRSPLANTWGRPGQALLEARGPAGHRNLQGQAEEVRQDGLNLAGRSQVHKTRQGGFGTECPVRDWLLSVLKTKGYRDGLISKKLAALCFQQRRVRLSEFLAEHRYGSLSEVLEGLPEAEAVPSFGNARDFVIRLRPGVGETVRPNAFRNTSSDLELNGVAENGSGQIPGSNGNGSGTEGPGTAGPNAFRNTSSDLELNGVAENGSGQIPGSNGNGSGTEGPGTAAGPNAFRNTSSDLELNGVAENGSGQIPGSNGNGSGTEGPGTAEPTATPDARSSPNRPESFPEIRDKVSQLLARHSDGISTFHLRQLYREVYGRPLTLSGHHTLKSLLTSMPDTISLCGLGVQVRLYPYSGGDQHRTSHQLTDLAPETIRTVGSSNAVGKGDQTTNSDTMGLPERLVQEPGAQASESKASSSGSSRSFAVSSAEARPDRTPSPPDWPSLPGWGVSRSEDHLVHRVPVRSWNLPSCPAATISLLGPPPVPMATKGLSRPS